MAQQQRPPNSDFDKRTKSGKTIINSRFDRRWVLQDPPPLLFWLCTSFRFVARFASIMSAIVPETKLKIRPAHLYELPALSDLCLRSKAYWKYDRAFIEACREELTITPENLNDDYIMVADDDGKHAGVIHLVLEGTTAELEKLFIDPNWIGKGVGRKLFKWAVETARAKGATLMNVVADPGAVPFYEKMGFKQFATFPSGSIPGRELPHMRLNLSAE